MARTMEQSLKTNTEQHTESNIAMRVKTNKRNYRKGKQFEHQIGREEKRQKKEIKNKNVKDEEISSPPFLRILSSEKCLWEGLVFNALLFRCPSSLSPFFAARSFFFAGRLNHAMKI